MVRFAHGAWVSLLRKPFTLGARVSVKTFKIKLERLMKSYATAQGFRYAMGAIPSGLQA